MYCIDASVITNSFFSKESHHKESHELLKHIRDNQISVYFPEIVLPEISSAISRGTNDANLAIEFIEELLAIPSFNFIPIDREISFLAAELAARYKLRGADAIHVATAKYFNIPLITLDLHQKENAKLCVNTFTPKEVNCQL